jgi:hypothetical protein
MNSQTGEITTAPVEETKQEKTALPITFGEMAMLKNIPLENRIKVLGSHRYLNEKHVKDLNMRRIRGGDFQAGYEFAMHMHELKPLAEEATPAVQAEAKEARVENPDSST